MGSKEREREQDGEGIRGGEEGNEKGGKSKDEG